MREIFTLITIGIGLSMDAFSVALGIGTNNLNSKKCFQIASIIGLFHFIMPLIGLHIGDRLIKIVHLNAHFLIAIILLLIAFEMIRNLLKKEKLQFDLSLFGIIIFAFTVSFDSFTTGLVLGLITNYLLLSATIFAILSFTFTYLGLVIGNYANSKLGEKATLFGAILLIIMAIHALLM